MAFEVPIEADTPDDLGFLSSFVRAPVVGTIMWVFGGRAAKEIDEKQRLSPVDEEPAENNENSDDELEYFYEAQSEPCLRDEKDTISFQAWDCRRSSFSHGTQRIFHLPSSESRPNMIYTDTSEDGDTDERSRCSSPIYMDDHSPLAKSTWAGRQSSSISWSDQSGQSLCEYTYYLDETNTSLQRSSSDVKAPTKSAMKQSSSLSSNSRPLHHVASEATKDEKTKGASESGPVPFGMPGASVPHGKGGLTGYVSPQYGWYVTGSTTPPTPEMYAHPRKGIKSSALATTDPLTRSMKHMDIKDSSTLQSSAFITMKGMKPPTKGQCQDGPPQHRRIPTPQFTKNSNVYGNSMGWPSVPL